MELKQFAQIKACESVLNGLHNKGSLNGATLGKDFVADSSLLEPSLDVDSRSTSHISEPSSLGNGDNYVSLFRSASFPSRIWHKRRFEINGDIKIRMCRKRTTIAGRDDDNIRAPGKCSVKTRSCSASPVACTNAGVTVANGDSNSCIGPGDVISNTEITASVQNFGEAFPETELEQVEHQEGLHLVVENNKVVTEKAPYSTNIQSKVSKKSSFLPGNCPPHGQLSVVGRRREMEDAVAIVPSFVSLQRDVMSCNGLSLTQSGSALHFFGVYDGHGGSQASTFCKERLHNTLAEEITRVMLLAADINISNMSDWKSLWDSVITTSFLKLDREVGGICHNGECNDLSSSSSCCSDTIAPGTVGTTAVVAVIGPSQIVIGNCGDSRAVLSRAGKAIALSTDHKPEREDERNRIEAAGGRVVEWDGYRVGGLLAMSRAIGDRYLKPYVIAEPEVTYVERMEEDEFLILATDGLWDVVNNDLACEVARKFLNAAWRRPKFKGTCSDEDAPPSAAAALLTKLALARGSADNISVIVIDLKARHR